MASCCQLVISGPTTIGSIGRIFGTKSWFGPQISSATPIVVIAKASVPIMMVSGGAPRFFSGR